MKKSEKAKGKEKAAARRRQYWIAGIAVAIVAVAVIVAYLVLGSGNVARAGDTVMVYYTGTLDNGTVFDSNVNGTPLSFTLGEGMVIPGFDEAVTGMAAGQTKTVTIPVDKAYGPYNPSLVQTVPRNLFPANTTLVPGEKLTHRSPDGTSRIVTVVNVTDTGVTVDANYPLAGQNLTFTIKVASIRMGSTGSTS
jgi:peptidylprolyl isomerase